MGGAGALGWAIRSRAVIMRRIMQAPGIDKVSGKLRKYPRPEPQGAAAKAAAHGDIAALRALGAHDLIDADSEGNTPLIWAADAGEEAAVLLLLASGADATVNTAGFLGNTALSRACRQGHEPIVRALLAVPEIDPNVGNDKMQFPLHFAAFQHHAGVVRLMLDSKLCDTFVTDRKGRTPAEDTKDAGIRNMILAARNV